MAQVVDPTPENTAFNLTNFYEEEVRASAEREPCPLPLRVDVCVLERYEATGEARRHRVPGSSVCVEWLVFDWYRGGSGHVMNDAGANATHDGRCPGAQRLLLAYVLSDDRRRFVTRITNFLWKVIFHAAAAQVQGQHAGIAILNVRCKAGRHRSLGWAFLAVQVLLLLGVRVRVFTGRDSVLTGTLRKVVSLPPWSRLPDGQRIHRPYPSQTPRRSSDPYGLID